MSAVRPSGRGRLEGKVAIITGAGAGMGEATAERFVAEGAAVLIADVDDRRAVSVANRLGRAARSVHLDVADPDDWRRGTQLCVDAFGGVDVLFNNAGIHGSTSLEGTTRAGWERTFEVDAVGALLGMQAVAPVMRRRGGGSIVNTSSLQGMEADVELLPYIAAKFAVRGISKAAAVELGRDGIRVNAIFPGVFDTGMNPDGEQRSYGHIPLRPKGRTTRFGRPADITGVVVFLASDAASAVTGAEIVVDGGKSIRLPTVVDDTRTPLGPIEGDIG